MGVFRVSRAQTGVEVCEGRAPTGVGGPTKLVPDSLAVFGLLKNCDGEKGNDLMGVHWGVVLDVEVHNEDEVVLRDELGSSR